MFGISFRVIALAAGIAAVALSGAADSQDQLDYVFSSWQAGAVGNCTITENHMTTDCEAALGAEGYRPPQMFTDRYLNNQILPDAPVGKRISVMIKLREPTLGLPPDASAPAVTALHLAELQRQYYPPSARKAKLEGSASADCSVRDNGQLDICQLTTETPAGAGFGDATLNVINLMKLTAPLPADRKKSFTLAWRIPGPADQVFVNCLVAPDFTTRDCTTDFDPNFPDAAQVVRDSLVKQPLHLAGAPVGQRIEIALLRSELEKPQTSGDQGTAPAPYHPLHLTALHGDDILYYYPALSVRLNETGYTEAKCKVTDDGRLNECWVSANPTNSVRLPHAHLRMAEIVHMQPPAANAPLYDQRIYTFRVNWKLQ
jgi:hypothetical protein